MRFRNLFLAGDFCQTFIDVVTVEGAVVSGLLAAEALRRKRKIGAPIDIIRPKFLSGASSSGARGGSTPCGLGRKGSLGDQLHDARKFLPDFSQWMR